MRKIGCLILLCTSVSFAHANWKEYLPEPKIKAENVSKWYAGAGLTRKLAHVNGEWANPYGVGYAKLGAFLNDDHEIGAQVGFRTPVALNGKDYNGFYLGAFAGQLKSRNVGTKAETQLGGGFDVAYVLLNKERISTFSVGIAAGEEIKRGSYVVYESKPEVQLSYTLSVGF